MLLSTAKQMMKLYNQVLAEREKILQDSISVFEGRFQVVRKRESVPYMYSHGTPDGMGVAILPFRVINGTMQVLLRIEHCPAHTYTDKGVYAITGKLENENDYPHRAARRELEEEAGYLTESFYMLPKVIYPDKQTFNTIFGFLVDLTSVKRGKALTDGTTLEQDAYCKWFDIMDVYGMYYSDPVLSHLLLAVTTLI